MTPEKSDDEKRFGRTEEVYAVGAVIVAWNLCESALLQLLFRTLKLEWRTASRTFHLMGDRAVMSLLANECPQWLDDNELPRVMAFISAYAACLENRNIIAHSQINMNDVLGGVSLQKASRKDGSSVNRFYISADEMKTIASTMYDLAQYGAKLSLSIWAGPLRTLQAGEKNVAVPLPDLFHTPRKLAPLPEGQSGPLAEDA